MKTETKNICQEETFRRLYLKYAKDIRQFLFFKTQNIERAEDMMQDAFIKLWDNCSNVSFDKVKSYLFTTANHLFINQFRHDKVVRAYENQSTTLDKEVENPEFIAIEKEFLEKINNTIAALPEKQREVFVMNRIEKKKYKEIAELLDISVKAVEKRMHQALVVMRKEIGNI